MRTFFVGLFVGMLLCVVVCIAEMPTRHKARRIERAQPWSTVAQTTADAPMLTATPTVLRVQNTTTTAPTLSGTFTTSNQLHLVESAGRYVAFECGVEYLDSSTCIQKTKRIRFTGAWEHVELCWRERCTLLDIVFPQNPPTVDVSK